MQLLVPQDGVTCEFLTEKSWLLDVANNNPGGQRDDTFSNVQVKSTNDVC